MWDKILDIIAWTITVIIVLSIFGAIFWAIGNFIILIFNLNFSWTFKQGVLTYIVIILLKAVLKIPKEERKENK